MKKLLLLSALSMVAAHTLDAMNDMQFLYAYEETALKNINQLVPICKTILEYEKEQLESQMAAAPCRKTVAYTALAGTLLMGAGSLIPAVGIPFSFAVNMCGLAGLLTCGEIMIEANSKSRYEQVNKNLTQLEHMQVSLAELKEMMVTK